MELRKRILELINIAKDQSIENRKSINDFKELLDTYSNVKHGTKPGPFSLSIADTGEKAFQRAILSTKTTLENLGVISWIDIELPVVFNGNGKRRCIDIIGMSDKNIPVLCELKFAPKESSSNTPIYAIIELLVYYYFIKENYEQLDEQNVFHTNKNPIKFEWSNFNNEAILIVAANKNYWEKWNISYLDKREEINEWFQKVQEIIPIHLYATDDYDFELQKNEKSKNGKYIPEIIENNKWTKIYF